MFTIKIGHNFLEFGEYPKLLENKYKIEKVKKPYDVKYRITEKPETLFNLLWELSKDYDIELI